MASKADATATDSGMALSVIYVTETSLLLNNVRRAILASGIISTVLMVVSILIFGGFSERIERLVPLHEEFIGAVIIALIILPVSIYLIHRATGTMEKWRNRLDDLSYALRFESQNPEGETPSVRLANQVLNALADKRAQGQFDPHEFADKTADKETFNVVIPGKVINTLSGHKGAVIATVVHGKPVLTKDLTEAIQKIRSLQMRLWRLLVVSDKEFPLETIEYGSSLSKKQMGFSTDLIEETGSGFSVVSLGG